MPLSLVCVLSVGTFLTFLDATSTNAVFPAVVETFHKSISSASWILNGGNLALAIGLMIGGGVADALGRRRVFTIGLVLYAGASLGCAMATVFWLMIVCRVALGLSGALVLLSSLALVMDVAPVGAEAKAIGTYSAVGAFGSVVGPFLAAFTTHYFTWRILFLFNVPVCLAGVWGTRWVHCAQRGRRSSINCVGSVLAGAALALLLLAPSGVLNTVTGARGTTAALCVAVVLLVLSEINSANPIVPRSLRTAEFACPLLATFGLGFCIGVGLLALPIFVTIVQGGTVSAGGLATAPASMISVIAAVASGWIAARRGYCWPLTGGMLLATVTLWVASVFRTDAPVWTIIVASALSGVAIGFGLPAAGGWAMKAADPSRRGAASGLYNMSRVMGIAVGVMTFSTIFSARISPDLDIIRMRLEQQGSVAAAETQGDVLDALGRLRDCRTPDCLRRSLRELGKVEATQSVGETFRSLLARRFDETLRVCAFASALFFLFWMASFVRGRGSGPPIRHF